VSRTPSIRVEYGDCLGVIPRLVAEGVVVDSIVTDPPYHLTIAKRFSKTAVGDDTDAGRRAAARSDAAGRLSRGFMGKTWDGGDVALRPETWAAVATILRPGGFLLAFGGTRTWHRLACAIEDAGFVIQDMVLWLYGSGFPKRRDLLKPAWEPIVVAYKPAGKRTLQVDECRIGTEVLFNVPADNTGVTTFSPVKRDDYDGKEVTGRWPANLCHDGSDEVEEAFAAFGESGGGRASGHNWESSDQNNPTHVTHNIKSGAHFDDSGSVARFFYTAKADENDRLGSGHPTVKPLELLRWLVPLVTPRGGLVLDPFAGTGTTGIAARGVNRDSILIDADEQSIADIRRRVEFFGLRGGRRRAPTSSDPGGRLF
jgi:site-specific DNA-methyltransferase (adenine-specific)